MVDYFEDVRAFHRKFGLIRDGGVSFPDQSAIDFRTKFMQEELDEFVEAAKNGDIGGVADALCDLVYVALGTAVLMNIPLDECWREVQRANMSKVRAVSADDERSKRKHSLDVVKPEGWKPPDVVGAILRAGTSAAKWDRLYMNLAKHVAQWSKDPSTKVGAVLVGRNRNEIAVSYNGFPVGIEDRIDRLENREVKYKLIQHAERAVLDNARFDPVGGTLIVTQYPCHECAKSIVAKKIARVLCPPPPIYEPWQESSRWAQMMLTEAGVKVDEVE